MMKHIAAALFAGPTLALAVMAGTAHAAPKPPTGGQSPAPAAKGACICTKEYNPVLGSDGKIYSNPCMAECAGVEVVPEGGTPPKPYHPPVWKHHHNKPWWVKFEVTFGHGEEPARPPMSIEELCPDDLPPGAVC